MDIVSLPIEREKDKIDSRFRLVLIAAQRARELAVGAKPKITTKYRKFPTIAIEEALENKVEFLTGEDARVANEEAKKFDYKRFLEDKRREAMPEDLSDLEKDLRVYLTEREDAERQAFDDLFADTEETTEEEEKPEE